MKHVIAIQIEDGQLKVLPQRWDSSQQMQDELPDGEYLLASTVTINAQSRSEKQNQMSDLDKQQAADKQRRKDLIDAQIKELQQQQASL